MHYHLALQNVEVFSILELREVRAELAVQRESFCVALYQLAKSLTPLHDLVPVHSCSAELLIDSIGNLLTQTDEQPGVFPAAFPDLVAVIIEGKADS